MGLDLSTLDKGLPRAVRHFWRARRRATKSQRSRGVSDQGNRSGVTAGKNMDGFVSLVAGLVARNGLKTSEVFLRGQTSRNLPGFFRATKNWDLLVVHRGLLVAAVEFKSQVGPSFGNNFNNRVEEALGNATDLNTAFREGVFGESPTSFVGYFFVLEDCPKSTEPVRFTSPHFPAMPEFEGASYADRYEIFCRKLVQERLYDAAALVLTPSGAARSGAFRMASELTAPRRFAAALAAKVAGMAAG